ncbi:MAG: hypothetical protein WCW03_02795 [Candidatus Paceibacterota bacterium]|jgi:peptidoglycan hydrolase CwlO-like protein
MHILIISIGRVFFFLSLALFLFIANQNIVHAQSNLTSQQRAELEAQLVQVEAEQKKAEADLKTAQSQSSSLSRDINVLTAKIKSAQLKIKAKNLLIQTLGNDIASKESHIEKLENRIVKGRETLAQILRKTNEIDQYSLPEMVLSQSTITGFFRDIDNFEFVEQGLQDTFEQLRLDKDETTSEKESLDKRRNAEIDARYIIQREQKNIEVDEAEKKRLLNVSKGNEKAYTSIVAEKSAKAAQIRSALFALRDSVAIPFGQALQYANLAYQKTGVRPAFLLAIMTQESNLGQNVGSCFMTSFETGDGIGKNTGTPFEQVMKAPRDTEPFRTITDALGISWSNTPVSCPVGGTKYYLGRGFGGAMGPAQFIASTWMLFKDRVSQVLGISGMPDPWNPSHAFTASSIYLSDLGADARTYSGERNAACRYYSGKSCGAIKGNTTYGNSVMALADSIQRNMIDPLQGY